MPVNYYSPKIEKSPIISIKKIPAFINSGKDRLRVVINRFMLGIALMLLSGLIALNSLSYVRLTFIFKKSITLY